nr:mucin-17-like [Cherax quadricarinatus]
MLDMGAERILADRTKWYRYVDDVDGEMRCQALSCPSPNCSHPEPTPGTDCCNLRCQGCAFQGQVFKNDQVFKHNCSTCVCQEGNVTCEAVECPDVPCSLPTLKEGTCCPTCPPCQHLGIILPPEYRFIDPDRPCTLCVCHDGDVRCFPEPCPVLHCLPGQHLVTNTGSCCPVCATTPAADTMAPLSHHSAYQDTQLHTVTQSTVSHTTSQTTVSHPPTPNTVSHTTIQDVYTQAAGHVDLQNIASPQDHTNPQETTAGSYVERLQTDEQTTQFPSLLQSLNDSVFTDSLAKQSPTRQATEDLVNTETTTFYTPTTLDPEVTVDSINTETTTLFTLTTAVPEVFWRNITFADEIYDRKAMFDSEREFNTAELIAREPAIVSKKRMLANSSSSVYVEKNVLESTAGVPVEASQAFNTSDKIAEFTLNNANQFSSSASSSAVTQVSDKSEGTVPSIVTDVEGDDAVPSVVTDVEGEGTVPSVAIDVKDEGTVPSVVTDVEDDGTVPSVAKDVKDDATVPSVVTDVKDDSTVPSVATDVKDDGTVPSVATDVKDDGTVPSVATDVKDDGIVPSVATDVKDDGIVPSVATYVKDDGTVPSVSTDVKDDGTVPSVATYVKDDGTVPSIATDVKDGTVPSIATDVKDDGTVPSVATYVKDDGTVPSVATDVKDDGTVPSVATDVKDDGTVPSVATDVKDDGTVPSVAAYVKEDGIVPSVATYVKDDGTMPSVSTDVKDDGTVPSVATDVKDDSTVPSIATDVKDDGAVPSIATDVKDDGTVPSIATDVKDDGTVPSVATDVKDDGTVPSVATDVKDDGTVPSIVTDVKDDGTVPSIATDVKDDGTVPSVATDVKDDGTVPSVATDVKDDGTVPSIATDVKDDGTVPSVATDVKDDGTVPSIATDVKDDGTVPSVATDVKDDGTVPSIATDVKDDGTVPSIATDVKDDGTVPSVATDVKDDGTVPSVGTDVKDDPAVSSKTVQSSSQHCLLDKINKLRASKTRIRYKVTIKKSRRENSTEEKYTADSETATVDSGTVEADRDSEIVTADRDSETVTADRDSETVTADIDSETVTADRDSETVTADKNSETVTADTNKRETQSDTPVHRRQENTAPGSFTLTVLPSTSETLNTREQTSVSFPTADSRFSPGVTRRLQYLDSYPDIKELLLDGTIEISGNDAKVLQRSVASVTAKERSGTNEVPQPIQITKGAQDITTQEPMLWLHSSLDAALVPPASLPVKSILSSKERFLLLTESHSEGRELDQFAPSAAATVLTTTISPPTWTSYADAADSLGYVEIVDSTTGGPVSSFFISPASLENRKPMLVSAGVFNVKAVPVTGIAGTASVPTTDLLPTQDTTTPPVAVVAPSATKIPSTVVLPTPDSTHIAATVTPSSQLTTDRPTGSSDISLVTQALPSSDSFSLKLSLDTTLSSSSIGKTDSIRRIIGLNEFENTEYRNEERNIIPTLITYSHVPSVPSSQQYTLFVSTEQSEASTEPALPQEPDSELHSELVHENKSRKMTHIPGTTPSVPSSVQELDVSAASVAGEADHRSLKTTYNIRFYKEDTSNYHLIPNLTTHRTTTTPHTMTDTVTSTYPQPQTTTHSAITLPVPSITVSPDTTTTTTTSPITLQSPTTTTLPATTTTSSSPATSTTFTGTLHGSCEPEEIGKTFTQPEDPCTACTCSSEQQWECVKTVCEDLDCPSEELHLEEGQCCPACKACEVQVGPELRQYGEGQSWHPPSQPCTLCVCHRGVPTCEPTLCPPQQQYPPPVVTPGRCRGVRCFRRLCFPGQEERLPPGSCCPVCAPASRGCVLWGRHLRTFDGVLLHHAHAHCVYTLATHCTTKLFTVYTKFVGESRGVVVSVVVEDLHLELGADGTVLLDGATVHLPYLTHKVALYTLHGSVVLVTAVGLQVVWSVGGQVEVQVGGEHGGTTCGLCGNFNYLPQDDLRLPSGETSQSVEEYLESWSIGKECAAEPDSHHCSSASSSSSASSAHLDPAHRLCSVLKVHKIMFV